MVLTIHIYVDGIRNFYKHGIITKTGQKIELEYVILATGFDIKGSMSASGINIIGRGGKTLQSHFDGFPEAYFGCIIVSKKFL